MLSRNQNQTLPMNWVKNFPRRIKFHMNGSCVVLEVLLVRMSKKAKFVISADRKKRKFLMAPKRPHTLEFHTHMNEMWRRASGEMPIHIVCLTQKGWSLKQWPTSLVSSGLDNSQGPLIFARLGPNVGSKGPDPRGLTKYVRGFTPS